MNPVHIAVSPITPDSLVPINMGLAAIGMALNRMQRKPETQNDCVLDITETVDELRKYVATLQGRTQ